MKRDMKPFVVEVKRGTRRSAFLGQMDTSPTMGEAQRRAEAALFAPALEEVATKMPAPSESSRRILRSLVEPPPPPPVIEDEGSQAFLRRPRPVGRPRKVKPSPQEAETELAERPPVPRPIVVPPPASSRPVSVPSNVVTPTDVTMPQDDDVVVHTSPPAAESLPPQGERQRLRDRSSILARYVLGTKPAPGEQWKGFKRLAERRSRRSE